MGKKSRRRVDRVIWILLTAAGAVPAAEFDETEAARFAFEAGLGSSDNIGRTVAGEQSETIASIGADFAVAKNSRRLRSDLQGDVAWLDYLDGTYASEVVGSIGAEVQANLIEGLLSWAVEDHFGQTDQNLLAPSTPANREIINQFATGPDISFRLASSTRLLVTGRYMRVDYEESPFDSVRFMETVGLRRDLSSSAGLTLRASLQHIDPQNSARYRVEEGVLSYAMQGARSELMLEAGGSRIKGGGRDSESGAVIRADLARRMGSRSRLTLRVSREISDSGADLAGWAGDQPPAFGGGLSLSPSSDPFVVHSVQFGWRIDGRITGLELAGSWRKEDSTNSLIPEREEWQLRVGGNRQLGPRLRAGMELSYTDQSLRGAGESNEAVAAVSLAWRLGRRFSAEGSGELLRFDQEASPDARENRLWLRLRYVME